MGLAEDIVALGSQAPAVISGLAKVVRTVGPVLPTVKLIVDDPAFPQVIARVHTLHEIEASRPPAPGAPPRPPGAPVGIGLDKAIPVLDAVIYARRNPWAPWAALGAVLLVIGGVGYALGRRVR
jgi:hypothetical protein